jgi:hypothetical protein
MSNDPIPMAGCLARADDVKLGVKVRWHDDDCHNNKTNHAPRE